MQLDEQFPGFLLCLFQVKLMPSIGDLFKFVVEDGSSFGVHPCPRITDGGSAKIGLRDFDLVQDPVGLRGHVGQCFTIMTGAARTMNSLVRDLGVY